MRWKLLPPPSPELVDELQKALSVNEILAQLLVQRSISNYSEAEMFFRPDFKYLHPPLLMKDMDKAVARITRALEQNERILIYGDYDVDGTTSVALMLAFLRQYTDQISSYIPDRYTEGYGVSYQGIDFAADNNFNLIIALDCGIKAVDKVGYAQQKGLDFIICDHHTPGEILPPAVAVLNPKQSDCAYPYKELCGCGVGFKLIQALHEVQGGLVTDLMPFLDLVAVAIGADIVPMTGENRQLMALGLQQLNTYPRPGFKRMLQSVKKKAIDVYDVVFVIAPRINAAGRMQHGSLAVALLSETDPEKIQKLAEEIENHNTDRKETDAEITREALEMILQNHESDRFTTVVYKKDWHKGVIGIVASRLTEHYYRPTVVFTQSGEKLAASARSVSGFDLYEALEACSDCIDQFGGHKYAAGLTLLPENLEVFKTRFEEVVAGSIDPELLEPVLKIDKEIDLTDVEPRLYRILKQMAPFGPGNMTPVFMAKGVRDTGYAKAVGKESEHLKLSLTQNSSTPIAGIGFGLGRYAEKIKNQVFDIVFTIDENEWNNQKSLQLKVKDIRLH